MNKVKKDLQYRKKLVKKNKLLNKILFNNRILTLATRTNFIKEKFDKLNTPISNKQDNAAHKKDSVNLSHTCIRNYCQITGRARGVLPTWKVSRIVFKAQADLGLIPGIRSASW